jgi:hypothetical protein
MRARRWWAVLWVVVVGVSVTACGDGASAAKSRAVVIAGATRGVGTARFRTEYESSGLDGRPDVTEGVVDFAHERGKAFPQAGRSSHAELRWIGPVTYSHTGDDGPGGLSTSRGLPWLADDSAREARALGCPTSSVPSGLAFLGIGVLGARDPVDVFDSLKDAGVSLHRVGTERVRGVSTTHWRASLGVRKPRPVHCTRLPKQSNAGSKTLARSLDVWTDSHDRARRLRTSTTSEFTFRAGKRARHDRSTLTRTTDFYDFGVPVSVVAPPASEVFDQTDFTVATLLGPGDVRGDWRAVAHGTFTGEPWTIWFATTSNGWRCYDSDHPSTSSALSVEVYSSGGAAPEPPTHDGRRASCSPPGGSFGPPFGTYLAGVDGDRYVLAGYADRDLATVTLQRRGGANVRVPVDPATGIVQWTGAANPVPEKVVVGRESCSLQPQFSIGSAPLPAIDPFPCRPSSS